MVANKNANPVWGLRLDPGVANGGGLGQLLLARLDHLVVAPGGDYGLDGRDGGSDGHNNLLNLVGSHYRPCFLCEKERALAGSIFSSSPSG